ncbi:energy transducer TonB [Pelagicoccus sp. SDUM812003]|uniref:energy transducer TonB n=1 Tax=Pelagicoccus sp. SDUM812003 TaxID=3041267 RepID=UPI00280C5A8E|nr:energy transducer TonB [Pelagicoccus sp. SDUM812003]MDQ8205486.1 energy transducer TonB [Pelagicoccus sp. SDUM812003]
MADASQNASKFENGYKPTRFNVAIFRAVIYAGLSLFAIYTLLPLTQFISGKKKDVIEFREFDIAQPPPPAPPDLEEPPEPEPQETPPPELREPPPPLDLAQLEMALNPGIGDAQAAGLGFGGLEAQPDALADLELFDVKDLDERPKPVRQVAMVAPIEFRKERRSGTLRIEIMIDESGRTKVLKILETPGESANAPAIEALEQWVWTPPKKNGEPVKARYIIPFGWRF